MRAGGALPFSENFWVRARAKPTGPGRRISTIGTLGVEGLKTAMCFEGTLKGEVFLQFLDQFLVPILRPDQIVLLVTPKRIR